MVRWVALLPAVEAAAVEVAAARHPLAVQVARVVVHVTKNRGRVMWESRDVSGVAEERRAVHGRRRPFRYRPTVVSAESGVPVAFRVATHAAHQHRRLSLTLEAEGVVVVVEERRRFWRVWVSVSRVNLGWASVVTVRRAVPVLPLTTLPPPSSVHSSPPCPKTTAAPQQAPWASQNLCTAT